MEIFGQETQATISEWANATFGEVKSPRSVLTRANCELAELVHAVECGAPIDKIAAEIADIIIVLCRYPIVISGICTLDQQVREASFCLASATEYLCWALLDDDADHVMYCVGRLVSFARALDPDEVYINLPAVIDVKMKINRGRTWAMKGTGHGQHVPATAMDAEITETLRLAGAYKSACAAIPGPRAGSAATYHAALTAAGNARRALLAHVSGSTPEVTP